MSVGEEVVSPCALGGCGQRLPTWMQKRTTLRRITQQRQGVSCRRFCALWICQSRIRPWAGRGELRERGSWSLPKRRTSFLIVFEETRWKFCECFTRQESGPGSFEGR